MHRINYGCKQFKYFIGKIYLWNFSFMSFSKGQYIETVIYFQLYDGDNHLAKVYKSYDKKYCLLIRKVVSLKRDNG